MTKYLKKNAKLNKNDLQYVNSFQKLKMLLVDPPIRKFSDFTIRFNLATDASEFAIGSVLTQDGHPISYASRTLNDHERRYFTTEKKSS